MMQFTFKILTATLVLAGSFSVWAQTCQSKDEIPEPARKAIEAAAQQAFDQSAGGNVQGLQASAIPSLQSNFNGISGAVADNKDAFAGAKPQLRNLYLLDTGANPGPDGTFYCGVFGANGMNPNTAEFDLAGIPVGKYAITIQDFIGNKGPTFFPSSFRTLAAGKLPDTRFVPGALRVMTVCGTYCRHAITRAKARTT